MRTITDHLNWAKDLLDKQQVEDANLSAKILLSFVTKISKIDFIKEPLTEVSKSMSDHFQQLVEKRGKGFPIAYLIGEKEFYGLRFQVNEDVLIPRPETELLIDWFGKKYGNQELKVCDVGTGSGAIAVTLKKTFPKLQVVAVDISADALTIAKKNADEHGVDIQFVQSNLLEKVAGNFDVIVANLPYIPSGDMGGLSREVQCEPRLALESGEDGLLHYQQLLPQAELKLESGGGLFVEYGIGQTQILISLLQKHFFSNIEVQKDHSNIDRIIHAMRK